MMLSDATAPVAQVHQVSYVLCLVLALSVVVYWVADAAHPDIPIWAPLAAAAM